MSIAEIDKYIPHEDKIELKPFNLQYRAVLSLVTTEGNFLVTLPDKQVDLFSLAVFEDRPLRTQLYEYLESNDFPIQVDHGYLASLRSVQLDYDKFIEKRWLFFSATVPNEAAKKLKGFTGLYLEGIRRLPAYLFRNEIYQKVLIRHSMQRDARDHGTRLQTLPPQFEEYDKHNPLMQKYIRENPWHYPFISVYGTS